MVNINDLLEKYFDGQTSLAEEKLLKQYFSSNEISLEHLIYKPLFEVFEIESKEVLSTAKIRTEIIPTGKSKHIWFRTLSMAGVAASIVVAFWFFGNNAMADDFAVINGKRINDAEYAQQFAARKLSRVNRMLTTTMKPIQQINKVNQCMEPIDKFADINDQLVEIKNKINLKH